MENTADALFSIQIVRPLAPFFQSISHRRQPQLAPTLCRRSRVHLLLPASLEECYTFQSDNGADSGSESIDLNIRGLAPNQELNRSLREKSRRRLQFDDVSLIDGLVESLPLLAVCTRCNTFVLAACPPFLSLSKLALKQERLILSMLVVPPKWTVRDC